MARTGRPSSYTPELANTICDRLSNGEALKDICTEDEMPGETTVRRWRDADEDFRAMYARAREASGDALAAQAVQIALSATPDGAAVARLGFDALRWYASKLAPKVYGERLQLDADVKAVMGISDMPLTQEQWAAQYAVSVESASRTTKGSG